jgi:hypothetical protein
MSYKKLVAITIPTRKRIGLLKECLDSINTKTTNKSLVEIIVKIDTDDYETVDFINSYNSEINLKKIISNRKNGYGSLHEHYNNLAAASESEFIFGFNDDVEMVTEGWEQYLIPYKDKNFILGVHLEKYKNKIKYPIFTGYNAHPIIPNDIFKYMGALSNHPMIDDWWERVLSPIKEQGLDLVRWIDVTLLFKRPDGVETDLAADTTFLESRQHINWNHHNSPELHIYTNKFIEYINSNSNKFT